LIALICAGIAQVRHTSYDAACGACFCIRYDRNRPIISWS
jgi:hypothetical protein